MDTANAPIFGIGVNGDCNEWNEKLAEITGYSRDFAFGKPLGKQAVVGFTSNNVFPSDF